MKSFEPPKDVMFLPQMFRKKERQIETFSMNLLIFLLNSIINEAKLIIKLKLTNLLITCILLLKTSTLHGKVNKQSGDSKGEYILFQLWIPKET